MISDKGLCYEGKALTVAVIQVNLQYFHVYHSELLVNCLDGRKYDCVADV
jgi:hypothetical protein